MRPPIIFHDDYVIPLPAGHRFPMGKFGALKSYLIDQGIVDQSQIVEPQPASLDQLKRVHSQSYIQSVVDNRLGKVAERELGLPMSTALAARSRAANGGTMLAARLALDTGLACNLAGGSHHAHAAKGTGFCVFNDVAVASAAMLAEGLASRVLIVDLDVHQGDGTASILRNCGEAFTMSIHCRTNFPARKQQSDFDIALEAGTGDDDYLSVLSQILPALLASRRPDLVFYNAGVDPHRDDRLGRLDLSDHGLELRDHFVIKTARDANLPLVCVLGGGYADRLDHVVARHAILHRAIRGI